MAKSKVCDVLCGLVDDGDFDALWGEFTIGQGASDLTYVLTLYDVSEDEFKDETNNYLRESMHVCDDYRESLGKEWRGFLENAMRLSSLSDNQIQEGEYYKSLESDVQGKFLEACSRLRVMKRKHTDYVLAHKRSVTASEPCGRGHSFVVVLYMSVQDIFELLLSRLSGKEFTLVVECGAMIDAGFIKDAVQSLCADGTAILKDVDLGGIHCIFNGGDDVALGVNAKSGD